MGERSEEALTGGVTKREVGISIPKEAGMTDSGLELSSAPVSQVFHIRALGLDGTDTVIFEVRANTHVDWVAFGVKVFTLPIGATLSLLRKAWCEEVGLGDEASVVFYSGARQLLLTETPQDLGCLPGSTLYVTVYQLVSPDAEDGSSDVILSSSQLKELTVKLVVKPYSSTISSSFRATGLVLCEVTFVSLHWPEIPTMCFQVPTSSPFTALLCEWCKLVEIERSAVMMRAASHEFDIDDTPAKLGYVAGAKISVEIQVRCMPEGCVWLI